MSSASAHPHYFISQVHLSFWRAPDAHRTPPASSLRDRGMSAFALSMLLGSTSTDPWSILSFMFRRWAVSEGERDEATRQLRRIPADLQRNRPRAGGLS